MKYSVILREVVEKEVEIEAPSKFLAVELAIRKYKDSEIILDPGEVVERKAYALPTSETEDSDSQPFMIF